MNKLFLIVSFFILDIINCEMNFICDNIYIGDKYAAREEENLTKNNITTVVNCAQGLDSNYKEIKYIELMLHDNSRQDLFPKLEVAYKFIKKNSKNNILIHCKEGRSRSASLVVFYLMKERNWDYDTCIKFIKEKRSIVRPNSGFVKQLKEYYSKNIRK